MNPLSVLVSLINVLVPFKLSGASQPVPVPGAGTVVSPVTTITNVVGLCVGAWLAKYGFDAASGQAIGGGIAAIVAAILNQLHLTGGSNVNTIASQNPTMLPVRDQ